MNVALPIVSQLVQVWVDSRKDGSKTTEIPFINDHRRTFTLIFTLMRQSLLMPLTPNTLRGLVLDDKYIKSWSEQGPDRWFFRASYNPKMGQFDIVDESKQHNFCIVVVLL